MSAECERAHTAGSEVKAWRGGGFTGLQLSESKGPRQEREGETEPGRSQVVSSQVALRIRPLSAAELEQGATVTAHKVGDQVRRGHVGVWPRSSKPRHPGRVNCTCHTRSLTLVQLLTLVNSPIRSSPASHIHISARTPVTEMSGLHSLYGRQGPPHLPPLLTLQWGVRQADVRCREFRGQRRVRQQPRMASLIRYVHGLGGWGRACAWEPVERTGVLSAGLVVAGGPPAEGRDLATATLPRILEAELSVRLGNGGGHLPE